RAVFKEYSEAMKHRLEDKQIIPEEANRMITPEMLIAALDRKNCVALSMMDRKESAFTVNGRYTVLARAVNTYNNQFPLLIKDLKRWKKDGFRVILLSASRTRAERLAGELQAEALNAFYSEDPERMLAPGEILVTRGYTRHGFEYPMQKFVLITETDIFGTAHKKKRRKKTEYSGQTIHSFQELSIGDAVVHETHGLGIYRGIEKVEMDHVIRDFVKIEYAGGSSLYVLATSLDVLQKYSGADGKHPKINKLGGNEWNRTRARVRSAVKDIAADLVKLYAVRQQNQGYAYGPDTVWQREFEEMFPFEETEDQLRAIEETKKDMESTKIMDRLICGDVGYGKTEIAIRAAFKAVQENKQVILLCPTTILAQQHYTTFIQRMKDYPVRIDMLSRFRTAAQQKKTIEDVRKGFVDILIGTHRVLSKDIVCKDLGLLIIDEEQRFGVTHKEKIKQTRENVDVLTLTATPIPRTLHMSLIGIRDMSILEEPPLDRMPIQTYIMEYDEELIREAVSRELARKGQVYVVYNRVRGIADMALRVKEMIPDASVAFAHGQMNERELERIMYDFVSGDIDVLVSTTIIETGMDISNVNTLIICDADRLGLAQLYQLRGRVGRSNRNAYAFLMYKRDKILREEAEKRLHAIREFTDLGSGVRIAMRDLEIRGAGNLLGAEQHGHMEAVGYDLYCKMLSEAVQEAKGERPRESFETAMYLSISAYIPPKYIPEEKQRLDMYKRIAGIENADESEDMLDELLDRFGEPPRSVQNLIRIALIKAQLHRVFVTEVRQNEEEIMLSFYELAELDPSGIPGLLQSERWRNNLFFRAAPDPQFTLKTKARIKRQEELLQTLQNLAEDLQVLLRP
ncbi:MAG: transcription-repair coupling factor, partial [Eubacterium sp.]|nr:transcription-repair coupling factor [Eubacterium sp.]